MMAHMVAGERRRIKTTKAVKGNVPQRPETLAARSKVTMIHGSPRPWKAPWTQLDMLKPCRGQEEAAWRLTEVCGRFSNKLGRTL